MAARVRTCGGRIIGQPACRCNPWSALFIPPEQDSRPRVTGARSTEEKCATPPGARDGLLLPPNRLTVLGRGRFLPKQTRPARNRVATRKTGSLAAGEGIFGEKQSVPAWARGFGCGRGSFGCERGSSGAGKGVSRRVRVVWRQRGVGRAGRMDVPEGTVRRVMRLAPTAPIESPSPTRSFPLKATRRRRRASSGCGQRERRASQPGRRASWRGPCGPGPSLRRWPCS
jgi:hypothetical protein